MGGVRFVMGWSWESCSKSVLDMSVLPTIGSDVISQPDH